MGVMEYLHMNAVNRFRDVCPFSITSVLQTSGRIGGLFPFKLTADHAGAGEEIARLFGEVIFNFVDDFFDAGVDDHFGAHQAGAQGAVEHAVFDADPVVGCLNDRIFLRMGADAITEALSRRGIGCTAGAASVATVFNAARRTVVASGDNSTVLHNDRRHFSPAAVSSLGNNVRDIHEIFIPVGTFG